MLLPCYLIYSFRKSVVDPPLELGFTIPNMVISIGFEISGVYASYPLSVTILESTVHE